MIRKVIGIDPSLTATAYCYMVDGRVEDLGRICSKAKGAERLVDIENMLTSFLRKCDRIDLAVIEGYSYGSPNQAHQIGELGGIIRRLLYSRAVPYIEIPPPTLKKYACGKGNVGKDEVMLSIRHHLPPNHPFYPKDNNEADAYFLAKLGVDIVCGIDNEIVNRYQEKWREVDVLGRD